MKSLIKMLSVAGLFAVAGFALAQENTARPLAQRGRVVRVEGQDRIVLKTQDNRDVIFVVNPATRYIVNGKVARLSDLTPGTELNTTYKVQDNRHIAEVVQVGNQDDANVFRGRVVKTTAPDQVVVRSQAGKEVVFRVQPQTRYTINGKAGQFVDLKTDAIIEARYVDRDNHMWIEEVVLNNAANDQPASDATQVQGSVVRIVGQNQVVIRTSDNKEITVDLAPQTTYTFDNQPGQLRDIQPGTDVRVDYNVRERRPIATRIFGRRIVNNR